MAGENGWYEMSLREAGVALIDCVHKTPPAAEDGYPYVAIPQMKGGRVELDGVRRITREHFVEWTQKALPQGHDVILSRRCNPGETAHVHPELNCALGQNLVLLRSDGTKVYPRFLRWLVRGPDWWEQVGRFINVGAVFDSLKCAEFPNFRLPIPPLPEQKAIAHILGTLDDKIELNRRMNETLESMARAIFKSWFVDFDPVRSKMDGRQPAGMDVETAGLFPDSFEHTSDGDLIPHGWMKTTLGDETDFQTGFAFKSKFFTEEPPGIRLARGMNVKEGEFFWSSQARYWPEITPDIEEYLLEVGDVLIGMDGSKVGKNWVRVRAADLPCLLVQRVARLLAASSIGENFIWILVGSSTFRYYVDAVKTGTSIPHISGGQIKSFDFMRPTRDDKRIFAHFESLVAPMTAQADKNHAESETLAALRDTLLPKLLSGELRIGKSEG